MPWADNSVSLRGCWPRLCTARSGSPRPPMARARAADPEVLRAARPVVSVDYVGQLDTTDDGPAQYPAQYRHRPSSCATACASVLLPLPGSPVTSSRRRAAQVLRRIDQLQFDHGRPVALSEEPGLGRTVVRLSRGSVDQSLAHVTRPGAGRAGAV
jgi:hypothetical protein